MLKIIVVAVARNFGIVAPKETTERSMEIKDSFVSEVTIFDVVSLSPDVFLIMLEFDIGHLPHVDGMQAHLHPQETTDFIFTSH
jgi:hypothetical protein